MRLDSFFFTKEFLNDEKIIEKQAHISIRETQAVLRSFGAYSLNNEVSYLSEGIPFIRGVNLKNGIIQFDDLIYISEDAHKLLWKSEVKPETVLLSMSGTIGEVAIALPEYSYPMNSNQDIAKIDFNGNFNPYFAYIFLLSKYGQNYLRREARGSVQQHVFLSQIENFKLPVLTIKFQERIEIIVKDIHYKLKKSATKYSKAEKLLLSELDLENFNPASEKVSIKTLKESFLKTGRLDSEYYQPKYDEYLKKVFSYSNGYELLGECCTIKDKNFMPKDDEEYRYIELANVRNNAQISDCDVLLGKELPTRARRKVNTGDVIVSSIEGSLESCALITEEYNNSLCSTGFYVVNSEKMNSESLLTVFKSSLMLNLMKKGCSGTILTNIVKEEFEKLPIPLLKQGVQDEIASYIKQSMEYSKKAKELLEISTKSVEIAIDKDEQAAHNFLEQNRTGSNCLL